MQVYDSKGRYVGVCTTQDQRVCDHCDARWMSGTISFHRTYSDVAMCHRCEKRRARRAVR